jgi:hypothetical protein
MSENDFVYIKNINHCIYDKTSFTLDKCASCYQNFCIYAINDEIQKVQWQNMWEM